MKHLYTCTPQEIRAINSRVVVAYLISKNWTQQEISESHFVSAATITRVQRFLDYEKQGGYKIAFSHFHDSINDKNTIVVEM